MRWAVPPPERQSTQFIETTRESSAGFYPLSCEWPIYWPVRGLHPSRSGHLVGAALLCIIQDALRFIFCIFRVSRNTITKAKVSRRAFEIPPTEFYLFVFWMVPENSNTIGCQFSRYWKRLLVWRLMYLLFSCSFIISHNNVLYL